MEYKCKNCGGELHYDPNIGKLKCDFCGSTYDLSEYQEMDAETIPGTPEIHAHEAVINGGYTKAMDDSTDIKEDLTVFQCPHCGAEIVTDKDTVATQCIFCHTPMVIDEQAQGKFRPAKVLPFEVDKKQIEQLYENYIKGKPFYPPEYSKANVIDKIRAIYLPFWLFDLTMAGEVNATGEHTQTFTSGQYIVTNHQVYAINREGSMGFHKIPVIGSSKTPKDAMDSIEPFDYSKLQDYNPGYLPGYLAQRYDLDSKATQQFSQSRAEETFNHAMMNTMMGYEGLVPAGKNFYASSIHADYVLLPSYLLFMDYDNNEDKLIAVNGQTGKIAGNIPVDKHKRNRFFITRFSLFALLFLGLAFLLLMLID